MSVLSIRGLGKRFGTTWALSELDLDVAQGSRTAIVGPSGSGKTTLLRLIAGFESPDIGHITLDGQPIANPQAGVPAHRRNIGLVMQEGALFPHLTVAENIRFGIRDQRDGEARVRQLLDLVELDRGMADRQPHQLSGGQQQRVALARALARQPRLMLLDEPFSALDTGLRDQLRAATAEILAATGIATMLVTHDREEAMGFADQLVVLRDGRLAQAGKPRDLYLAPVDAEVGQFLGPAVILDAEVTGGTARCLLGSVPVACDGGRVGHGRILLRPEQLHLSSTGDGMAPWMVQTVEWIGGAAHVTLRHQESSATVQFPSGQYDLPSAGAPCTVRVSGSGWILDVAGQC